jgi:hypothetical protein
MIGGGGDRVRGEVLAAVILVPGDLVVIERDAESTSISPSPSTSAANTLGRQNGAVEIVCAVKFWLPSFSYQAILSS